MTKAILFLMTLAFALACGSPGGDEILLGELDEAISVRPLFGVNSGGSPSEGLRCTNSAGQTCLIPADKIVTFRCSGFAAGAETDLCNQFVDSHALAMQQQFGAGWAAGRVSSNEEVLIIKGNLAESGTATLHTYLLASFTSGAALAESPAQPATWRKLTKATVTVDWAAVDANFSGQALLRNKAQLVKAAMSFGVGLGLNSSENNRPNSVNFSSGAPLGYSTSDVCRAVNFDPTGASIAVSGAC